MDSVREKERWEEKKTMAYRSCKIEIEKNGVQFSAFVCVNDSSIKKYWGNRIEESSEENKMEGSKV